MRRRALRVMRPAREKKRRRRVLVVATGSPRPMRAVQRARLWTKTPYRVRGRLWTAGQAPLAGKRPEGRWVEPHAVLQVADGILDLGMAAMVGLEIQGVVVSIGDEGVISVVGKQRQLGAGRGLDPPDDETHRGRVELTTKWCVFSLGHVGGALYPVGYGRPVLLGNGLDDVPHALVLANGDGEADVHLVAGGDDGVGVEG